jgi:cytochrome d ubiquinol oxidase subunit I
MKVLLDRWQFGVTITYHFLFVPLTVGLALLVAVMQVLAYRRRDEVWEQLTRFFGTLFLINFAMGVVTGIVQEFQFGMNWSSLCGCSAGTGCPRWRIPCPSAW